MGEDRRRGQRTEVSVSIALLYVGPSSALQSPPTVEEGEAAASVVVAGAMAPSSYRGAWHPMACAADLACRAPSFRSGANVWGPGGSLGGVGEGGGGAGGGGYGEEPGTGSDRVAAGVDLHTGEPPVGRIDSCNKAGNHQTMVWYPSRRPGGGCWSVLGSPVTIPHIQFLPSRDLHPIDLPQDFLNCSLPNSNASVSAEESDVGGGVNS